MALFKQQVNRPIPAGAEIVTRNGKRLAKWKDRRGKTRTAELTADGLKIKTQAATWSARYRDGNGIVRTVATGCRDKTAAQSMLSGLTDQAELVSIGVLTDADLSIAEARSTAIVDNYPKYEVHQKSAGISSGHIKDSKRLAFKVFEACRMVRLRDITRDKMERWMVDRQQEGMGARCRNTHLKAVRTFCRWCVDTSRLSVNPVQQVKLADEKSDRRKVRRAMTEDELRRLLYVAQWRPIAEFGREVERKTADELPEAKSSRATWKLAPLTIDAFPAAIERAKRKLQNKGAFAAKLDRRGRERSLIYKTLLLTGLRRGELGSIQTNQVRLDFAPPVIELAAADEKNGNGSQIVLRSDLAEDLRNWIEELTKGDSGNSSQPPEVIRFPAIKSKESMVVPLFKVPKSLFKVLDRDLAAAGIAKIDDRGRSLDVHALRTTFGTMLSAGGVSPRTAQEAMRHSDIGLTMGAYVDPLLLDVAGAVASLPTFSLDGLPPDLEPMRTLATGTDGDPRTVTPTVTLAADKSSVTESSVGKTSTLNGLASKRQNPGNHKEIQGFAQYLGRGSNPQPSASEVSFRPNFRTRLKVLIGNVFQGIRGFSPLPQLSRFYEIFCPIPAVL